MKLKRWYYQVRQGNRILAGSVVTTVGADEKVARAKIRFRIFGREPRTPCRIAIKSSVIERI